MEFFLQRIVLIDSYSTGRVVEFPLEGGAVLTGRNGRGKTTLLQLIPIFYGESPSRLLDKGANRLSFTQYYLPRTTSYIVFEYRRRGGVVCCVALFADTRDELNYMFLRQPYALSLFVSEDQQLVENPDLLKHVKKQGVAGSGRIGSVQKYRHVIQAIQPTGGDKEEKQQIKQLIADYAFTPSNQPLKHIEKIVSGMFKRRTHFDDLQMMVVDCITDNQQQAKLVVDRAYIEQWPKDYQAYQAVMAKAELMAEALVVNQTLQTAEMAMLELHGQCRSLLLAQEINYQHQQIRSQQLSQQLAEQQSVQRIKQREYEQEIGKLQQEAAYYDDQAAQLVAQQADYQQQKMEDKAALAEQAPQLRDELYALQKRLDSVLGEQKQISVNYQQFAIEAKDTFAQQLRTVDTQKANTERDYFDQETALAHRHQQSLIDVQQDIERQQQPIRPMLSQLQQDYGAWQQAVKQAQPSLEAQQQVQAKEEVLAQQRKQQDSVRQQRDSLNNQRHSAQRSFAECERTVSDHKMQLAAIQAEQARLQQLYAPPADSLLAFLRQEHPQWTFDIAKVIDEKLLLNTHLKPQLLTGTNAGLYGVELDLSDVASLPAADNQQAEEDLNTINYRLQQANEQLQQAEKKTAEAAKAYQTLDKQHREQEAKLQQAQNQERVGEQELAEAKRQQTISQKEQQQHAQRQLEEVQRQRDALQHQLDALTTELVQRQNTLKQQHQQRQQHHQQEKKDALALLDAQRGQINVALQEKLNTLAEECAQALASKGIDVGISTAIEQQIKHAHKQLATIRELLPLIQEWKIWLKNQWPQREHHQQQAQTRREQEQQQRQTLQHYQQDGQQQQTRLSQEIRQLKEQAEHTLKQINDVTSRCQQLFMAYPWPEQQTLSTYDPIWTAESLIQRANQQKNHIAKQQKQLDEQIRQLRKVFNDYPNHAPYQFLDAQRSDTMLTDRDWLEPLSVWFEQRHKEYLSVLLQQAKTIIGSVIQFKRLLEDFHSKIQSFNRELQQSFDDNPTFDSFSQLEVKVVSTIKELEYWQSIAAIAETHHSWNLSTVQSLPPPEFVQTLQQLLAHWEVKSGIQAELKYLIRIEGSVVENQQKRHFRKASDLETISSNGVSYLILCNIFVAFINRIRRHKEVGIVWALDELKDLDSGNITRLLELLTRNHISLACAFPDPDSDTLVQFKHRFSVEADRRLAEVKPYVPVFSIDDMAIRESSDV
jgi:hypothetical protein